MKLNFGLFPGPIPIIGNQIVRFANRIDLALERPSSDIMSDQFPSRERQLKAIHLSQSTGFSKI